MEEMEKKNKEEISLRPIIINYLLHWKLIIGTGLFAVLAGILYLVCYPKTYETVAQIQIQDENDLLSGSASALGGGAAGLMKSFGLGGGSAGSIVIDDEIATLTSNFLLSEAIHQLGLFTEYSEPFTFGYKLYGNEPLKVTADSTAIARLEDEINFNVSVSPNKITIKTKVKRDKLNKTFRFENFPAVIKLKQGDFVFNQTDAGRKQGSYKLNVKVRPLVSVAGELANEIIIDELSKSSNVIEFFIKDYEKQRSKDIVNTLIELYNAQAMGYREKLAKRSMTFLDGRIENLLTDLSVIESTIATYKTQNQMTIAEADVQYYNQYMKELQTKMIETEAQIHIIKLMKTYIQDPSNHYKLIPTLLTTGSDSESSPLTLYNKALLERERIIQNSGADNPMIVPLTLQIDKLRESVYQMIENEEQSNLLVIQELKGKEKSIIKRIESVPQQEKMYVDYRRQQEILQGVYLILLQKREDTALTIGQSKEKAKIIDPAYTKPLPVAPRKLFAAIGVIVFTLLITIGWLFGKEQYLAFKEEYKRRG